MSSFDELRKKIFFHTRYGIKDNTFSMIIGCGSNANVVSLYVVQKLDLTCINLTTTYKYQWLNTFGQYKVTTQCMISLYWEVFR